MAYAPPGPGADQPRDTPEDPPYLKRLRLLVMVLTVALILGIVTIAATIVIRLGLDGGAPGPAPVAAERIALPPDHAVETVGQGPGSVLMVLRGPAGGRALWVFDAATGEVLSRTALGD